VLKLLKVVSFRHVHLQVFPGIMAISLKAGWGFIFKEDHEQLIMQDATAPVWSSSKQMWG
jgi:hypothetical protein